MYLLLKKNKILILLLHTAPHPTPMFWKKNTQKQPPPPSHSSTPCFMSTPSTIKNPPTHQTPKLKPAPTQFFISGNTTPRHFFRIFILIVIYFFLVVKGVRGGIGIRNAKKKHAVHQKNRIFWQF